MRINEFVPDSKVFDFNKSVQGSNLKNGNIIGINKNSSVTGDTNTSSSISDFASVLKDKLDDVNNQQIQADNSTKEFVEGDRTDIHNVMLDTEQAKQSLELAVQIRDKLVDAYQELNRTQF